MGRRIALDIARGLHFLHSRKIVHFDLKSANILLSRDFTAKIADVGLAKIMQQQFLSTLYCVGTFAWAAPEVGSEWLLASHSSVHVETFLFSSGMRMLKCSCFSSGMHKMRSAEIADTTAMWRCQDLLLSLCPTHLHVVHVLPQSMLLFDIAFGAGAARQDMLH